MIENTTDRLVRILDEGRTGHVRARKHASELAQRLSGEERTRDRLRADLASAEKTIRE